MNYGEIKNRTSQTASACVSRCLFRPHAPLQNRPTPKRGISTTSRFIKENEDEVLAALAPGFINGLTLLGGEPMEPQNQRALVPFLHRVRKLYPEKDICCYSGSTLETDMLKDGGRNRCEVTDEFLSLLDVLVDGAFVDELKDISSALSPAEPAHHRYEQDPRNRGSHPLERETAK